MADFGVLGELVRWSPGLFPHDPAAAAGQCRFAPNCGGVPKRDGSLTRADHAGCPSSPAEYAERTGMTDEHEGAGFERYIALCRSRAERRFGAGACSVADSE